MIEIKYSSLLVSKENKVLTMFLMLQSRQRVDYDLFNDLFGCKISHFYRIIASVRDSLEVANIRGQIIYNREAKTYILVKVL